MPASSSSKMLAFLLGVFVRLTCANKPGLVVYFISGEMTGIDEDVFLPLKMLSLEQLSAILSLLNFSLLADCSGLVVSEVIANTVTEESNKKKQKNIRSISKVKKIKKELRLVNSFLLLVTEKIIFSRGVRGDLACPFYLFYPFYHLSDLSCHLSCLSYLLSIQLCLSLIQLYLLLLLLCLRQLYLV